MQQAIGKERTATMNALMLAGERDENTWQVLFGAGSIALLGLQAVVLPWVLSTLLTWSTDDLLEGTAVIPLAVLPLFIAPLLLALMFRFTRFLGFIKILRKALLPTVIGIQLLLDWIIYAKFHHFWPFSAPSIEGGLPFSTGWLSTDILPAWLLVGWLNWTMLAVIPAVLGAIISRSTAEGIDSKRSMHSGMLIIGMFMVLRWSGAWSVTFHHLVSTALLLPLVLGTNSMFSEDNSDRKARGFSMIRTQDAPRARGASPASGGNVVDKSTTGDLHLARTGISSSMDGFPARRISQPIFSTIGISFTLGFMVSALQFQGASQPNPSWPWLGLVVGNGIILVASFTDHRNWFSSNAGMWTLRLGVTLMVASVQAMVLSSLFSWFSLSRNAWIFTGLITMALVPEVLQLKASLTPRFTGSRRYWAFMSFIFGMIMAIVGTLYDPITSYVSIGIIGLFQIMIFFRFTKPVDPATRDKAYAISAIVLGCTVLLSPMAFFMAISSAIRGEKQKLVKAGFIAFLVGLIVLILTAGFLVDFITSLLD
ncbi:hypothetical protein GF325_00245 [Candidatus Bathyarchaeota archaeon]|nr:hypothetical protein [Candidatus Bathyarchaeota archaeon]